MASYVFHPCKAGQATGLPQGRTQSLSPLLQDIHGFVAASSVFVGSMEPCFFNPSVIILVGLWRYQWIGFVGKIWKPETIDFSSKYGVIWGYPGWFIWLVVYLPLWKIWVRQLGWLFPIYKKIENVPNHQSVMNIMSVVIGYDINYINLIDYKLDYNDRGIGNRW